MHARQKLPAHACRERQAAPGTGGRCWRHERRGPQRTEATLAGWSRSGTAQSHCQRCAAVGRRWRARGHLVALRPDSARRRFVGLASVRCQFGVSSLSLRCQFGLGGGVYGVAESWVANGAVALCVELESKRGVGVVCERRSGRRCRRAVSASERVRGYSHPLWCP